jgi:hypothetical protein
MLVHVADRPRLSLDDARRMRENLRLALAQRERPGAVPDRDSLGAGLAGDGHVARLSVQERRRMIAWIRFNLLDATYSDRVCELLFMSLDAGKREELLRRAADRLGAEGF